MSNTFSKSSTYVNSLVDFTLDTKPYHSKLTEVAVEYRFEDTVNVKIEDAVANRMVKKAGWLYNYFSGGDANNRTFDLKRLVHPNLRPTFKNNDEPTSPGAFKAFRDENTDMALVPLVFDKKATAGMADVWRERLGSGTNIDAFVEGHEFFQNHGSLELQVSYPEGQVDGGNGMLWQETRAEGVMTTVTSATQLNANDVLNPSSANRRIFAIMSAIQAQVAPAGPFPNASAKYAVDQLIVVLDTPALPQSYEPLWVALEDGGTPVINNPVTGLPYTAWRGEDGYDSNGDPLPGSTYVDDHVSQNTPSAYFNYYSDGRLREQGTVSYDDQVFPGFGISNIQSTLADEWTVTVISVAPITFEVVGAVTGYVGGGAIGVPFSSTYVTFDTAVEAGTAVVGDVRVLTPEPRLVIDPTAPLEVWNIIKTNPIAYSRPTFVSTRYGYIRRTSDNAVGAADILDVTLPTSTVILTALNSTTFSLTSTVEPGFTATITVGTPFATRLGFTIVAGTARPFTAGDRFYLNIINDVARAEDFDLYYGYDLDSYDVNGASQLVYNNQNPGDPNYNVPLDFRFDSRFVDYNLDTMNLQIAQNAISGYRYRLSAIPDGAPIAIIQKDGSGPTNVVDLAGETSGIAPDPSLVSLPLVSMAGDANPNPDLLVYYANNFKLERSTDNGSTWTTLAATVPVGSTYTNATEGITFTLAPGSKPFIAVQTDDLVQGGDVFLFKVLNEPPLIDPVPVIFSSRNVPRLIMHGDGFWDAPAAEWTVTFSTTSTYSVTAIHTDGPNVGQVVSGYPVTGYLNVPGTGVNRNLTFKNDHVHFTVVRGASGVAAGDQFRFRTYADKPSFLVHGSTSGWQPDAEIGKWYWNGKIGFKINTPVAQVFQNGDIIAGADASKIAVTRVRPDTPELVYTFTKVVSSLGTRFTVNRSDVGIIDGVGHNGTFKDKYLTVTITDPADSFQVGITTDQFQYWNATDTVIIRPTLPAFYPAAGDFFSFRKAENDRLGINLSFTNVLSIPDTTALGLVGINTAFIDVSTGGVPIQVHSPEAVLFNSWMPLKIEGYDAVSSIAHFPDVATEVRVTSAASGEAVGRIYSDGTLNEPIRFEWDTAFFTKYLPLNASSNVVTYNSVLNENVKVSISERINFLTSGGVLLEDAMFNDDVFVSIAEEHTWNIDVNQLESVGVVVADGPFGGFLAGYDNLPYDAEDALGLDLVSLTAAQGRYDTGAPLVDHYLRAQYLETLTTPTVAEQQELTILVAMVFDYLQPGGISFTSLPQFLAALNADPFATSPLASTFGLPKVGAAFDTLKQDTSSASTAITEGATFVSVESASAFDEMGFDAGGLDAESDSTAILMSLATIANASPPPAVIARLPVPSPIPAYAGYALFETPLFAAVPARVFEVTFAAPIDPDLGANYVPSFFIWTPAMVTPEQVDLVVRLSDRRFRFSLPAQTEAKVFVT